MPLHPNRILRVGIACANNVVAFIVLKVANGTVADLGRFSVINMQIINNPITLRRRVGSGVERIDPTGFPGSMS